MILDLLIILLGLLLLLNIKIEGSYQGRIQDLWLGGAWVGGGSGDRFKGPQLAYGRTLVGGPGGQKPPLKFWGF